MSVNNSEIKTLEDAEKLMDSINPDYSDLSKIRRDNVSDLAKVAVSRHLYNGFVAKADTAAQAVISNLEDSRSAAMLHVSNLKAQLSDAEEVCTMIDIAILKFRTRLGK